MNELDTLRQKELIKKLSNGSLKQIDLNYLETGCTKEAADKWIKELIADANNGNSPKDKEYPISFQAFVKAAAVLYANRTDKTFKDIIKEVKEVY